MTNSDTTQQTISTERDDLVEALDKQRGFLRYTVGGITEDQARRRTTVSELTLGGLVKHVTDVEAQWASFMVEGPTSAPDVDWDAVDWANPPAEVKAFQDSHRLLEGETLTAQLARYAEVAARTDDLVRELDLDTVHALPTAPWFEAGATWSVRRTVLHILAETAQHAGHADIVREALDGQKTMG